ncbi:NAD(P)/FAD-dependent oxidoreductase [Williamsia deligens]|uniref:NAD(P)/FAD-dependent oxidoreductase n=1 Tax=Williamsia deligens TaxID=321325 RepID=A0ABW3G4J2_9NOCA|nr:NAD(P)/FAD-dependent oxidoreductase [Williamsia deligens]MCP2193699.1 Flavin containing amine oxidoreductase [Williamsia deligens]
MTGIDVDVVVVGAGLAGLRCAGALRGRGLDVLVLERSDGPGGRVRTDTVDGFRCDRGFQLINPSYPALARHVDLDALDLRVAGRGVRVVDADGGVHTLADPFRHPDLTTTTLASAAALRLLRPRAVVGAVRWALPALGPVRRLQARPDAAVADDWDRLGVEGPLRDAVLLPFLSGVLADTAGVTSDRYVRLVLRSFLRATPGVPAIGMQALPDQLAARCGATIRYDTAVDAIDEAGSSVAVRTAGGERIVARAVVVATDAVDAAELTGFETAPMRGLMTWWFSADGIGDDAFLRVSGSGGPLANTAVMSSIAPDYAPSGATLVQASAVLTDDHAVDDVTVRAELAHLWQVPTDKWDLVTRTVIPRALPSQTPGLPVRRPVRVGERTVMAGDHRDTPSLQGAMVSGGRAATAAIRLL